MGNAFVRAGYLVAALLLVVVAGAATASASMLAETDATMGVSTATWSVIPAAPGGTSVTTSFSTSYGAGATKYALVDIYNNGSVPITGFTITGSRGGSGSGVVQSCATGWAPPAKSKDAPMCSGADSGDAFGTLTPGQGLPVATTIQPGGRLSLRIRSSNATWSLSVAVTV